MKNNVKTVPAPPRWAVTTRNDASLEFAMNRQVFTNEESPQPTFVEFIARQRQTIIKKVVVFIDGEQTTTEIPETEEVVIPIQINCGAAEIMARTILHECLPNFQHWCDKEQPIASSIPARDK